MGSPHKHKPDDEAIRLSTDLFEFMEEFGMVVSFMDCNKEREEGCFIAASPAQLQCMRDALEAKE